MTGSGAAAIAARVRSGARSAADTASAALARIAAEDGATRAFLHLCPGLAAEWAADVDRGVRETGRGGRLAGVPVAVKDNICVRGVPATCGSRQLQGYVPPYHATAVERLRAAGAVVVGKTNLDEFAMGSSTEHSAFHPTCNPWDRDRVPGGSSGGSAAAVAAGLVPVALGSDTGGSIRQPAAFCGVFGLKPTYGRVSRYGLVAFASSLDQIGPLARTVEDLALVYEAVAGPDPRDATCAQTEPEPIDAGAGVAGLRLGIMRPAAGSVSPEVGERLEQAADVLAEAGAQPAGPVDLIDPEEAVAAYYVLAPAEASSNLARYDGVRYGFRAEAEDLESLYRRTRSRGFGDEVKRRILVGTYALSAGYYDAYYGRAQRTRAALRRSFDAAFARADLILLPTTPSTAFRLGERLGDPVAMYEEDLFTVYANLTGLPAIHVPCGHAADGLPVGVQLLAPAGREDRLFRAAAAIEGSGRWPVRCAPPPGPRP